MDKLIRAHVFNDEGESIIDYLMGCLEANHMVNSFQMAQCPIGVEHSFPYFELHSDIPKVASISSLDYHTTIYFTHKLSNNFSRHVQVCLPTLNSSLSVQTLTTQLTYILHSSAINSFQHTRDTITKLD